MSDGALTLFQSLVTYDDLQQLVDDGVAEGLHLECKSPSEPRLNQDMRGHLERCLSGFANTAGGVIIWGISTTKHQHSGLDILTQLEPLGAVARFAQQIQRTIPTLTTPAAIDFEVRTIHTTKGATRGIVLAYVPQASGDPVQTNSKNPQFYWRTGDDFSICPFDMLRRLFAGTSSPELRPLIIVALATRGDDGAWRIPIAIENLSSAVGRDTTISARITNPEACAEISSVNLLDASGMNPGQTIFMKSVSEVIHRGLNVSIGELLVRMKPRRKNLDLEITLYADKMRARGFKLSLKLEEGAIAVRRTQERYLY